MSPNRKLSLMRRKKNLFLRRTIFPIQKKKGKMRVTIHQALKKKWTLLRTKVRTIASRYSIRTHFKTTISTILREANRKQHQARIHSLRSSTDCLLRMTSSLKFTQRIFYQIAIKEASMLINNRFKHKVKQETSWWCWIRMRQNLGLGKEDKWLMITRLLAYQAKLEIVLALTMIQRVAVLKRILQTKLRLSLIFLNSIYKNKSKCFTDRELCPLLFIPNNIFTCINSKCSKTCLTLHSILIIHQWCSKHHNKCKEWCKRSQALNLRDLIIRHKPLKSQVILSHSLLEPMRKVWEAPSINSNSSTWSWWQHWALIQITLATKCSQLQTTQWQGWCLISQPTLNNPCLLKIQVRCRLTDRLME